MQQKRQALSSARIQMSQAGFAEVARTFSTLRYEDLEKRQKRRKKAYLCRTAASGYFGTTFRQLQGK